jgi:hypothetical protein
MKKHRGLHGERLVETVDRPTRGVAAAMSGTHRGLEVG